MSSAYFLPLVFRPDVITQPGVYRTRCGDLVVIKEVSTKHDFGCHGTYMDMFHEPDNWHKSGRLFANVQSANDVVAYVGHHGDMCDSTETYGWETCMASKENFDVMVSALNVVGCYGYEYGLRATDAYLRVDPNDWLLPEMNKAIDGGIVFG